MGVTVFTLSWKNGDDPSSKAKPKQGATSSGTDFQAPLWLVELRFRGPLQSVWLSGLLTAWWAPGNLIRLGTLPQPAPLLPSVIWLHFFFF